MSAQLKNIQKDLQALSNKTKAAFVQGYFKTGKGEYGEGDIFLGITVPQQRIVAKKYYAVLDFSDFQKLLESQIHEYRFTCLEMLVFKFEKSKDEKSRKQIFNFYIKNKKYINNWDLVDTSSPYIVGGYLHDKDKSLLYKLAQSKNIWDRRIAIVATYNFIKKQQYTETLKISEILLHDTHDLIHKAVGWMLREVGNKSVEIEEEFLKKHYKQMPRTMLRYAIEKFPKEVRKLYLAK